LRKKKLLMGDFFTLRELLLQYSTAKSTVGSRDRVCLACRERYHGKHVTKFGKCWDELVDDAVDRCDESHMCRPLLTILIRDCLAFDTDASLFTYRCNSRSAMFDNVSPKVIETLQYGNIQPIVKRLNKLLEYKNAKRSLGAFVTMVQEMKSKTRRSFVREILHFAFHNATRETDLALILEAMNSGALLFMDVSRGFIMKSPTEVDALKDVPNKIKFHQIARLFPGTPVVATELRKIYKNDTVEDFVIDPSLLLIDEVFVGEISYANDKFRLGYTASSIKHYLDESAIFRYLFNTIYENGRQCLGDVTANLVDLKLVSKWSSPGFESNDNVDTILTSRDNTVHHQFDFQVTTTSSRKYVYDMQAQSDEYIEEAALNLFLVYFQAVQAREIDFSFLDSIRAIQQPVNTYVPISFVYGRSSSFYKVTKIKNPTSLNIAFGCGHLTRDTKFEINKWYTEILSTFCANKLNIFNYYSANMNSVMKKLCTSNVLKSDLIFKCQYASNYIVHIQLKSIVGGHMFVMFYSGELTDVHDKLFYLFSLIYNRKNLERFTTRQVEPHQIQNLISKRTTTFRQVVEYSDNMDEIKENITNQFTTMRDEYLMFHFKSNNILFYCKGLNYIHERLIDLNRFTNLR
jgi:hypothetical protein